jgi:hypothetical protein
VDLILKSLESSPQPYILCLRFNLVLLFHLHLRLPSGRFPSGVSTKMLNACKISTTRSKYPALSFFLILKIFGEVLQNMKSRDSSAGIALGYGLDDRGSIPGGCWEFFSKPPRPERLWSSPSLLSNGYQGLFPWG